MIIDNIHLNSFGEVLKVPIPEDVDLPSDLDGSDVLILYNKPSGDSGEWAADMSDEDGFADYTTEEGDIDEAGVWKIQLKITTGADQKYYSDIMFLRVLDNVQEEVEE